MLQTSTYLVLKIYAPATQPKPFLTLQIFQLTSSWCQKKNIGTTQFLGAQELHSQSTLNVNVCIFLYIALWKFLFQRRSKLLSGFIFYLMNNFVKGVRCLGFRKIFYSFSLPLKFLEIQLYFSISIIPSIESKRWNFPGNFDFKGKIVVKGVRKNSSLKMKRYDNKITN